MSTIKPVEDTGRLEDLRAQIDRYDAEIVRLVIERAKVARLIQKTRVRAGETRIELGREAAILLRYRQQLGKEGMKLGDAVLRVCRGPF
jgi:monofunctional chorismate mutase